MNLTVVRVDGVDHLILSVESRSGSLVLTATERKVLRYAQRGDSNATIARARGVSVHTISKQLRSGLAKLGLRSRAELQAFGSEEIEP
ncbi:MAG: helix-turn-helix transcriptional regulator [Myxococcales bacterium]|nr:helix-turn-helix transcriptional regulator [Myxococcales bacterium]